MLHRCTDLGNSCWIRYRLVNDTSSLRWGLSFWSMDIPITSGSLRHSQWDPLNLAKSTEFLGETYLEDKYCKLLADWLVAHVLMSKTVLIFFISFHVAVEPARICRVELKVEFNWHGSTKAGVSFMKEGVGVLLHLANGLPFDPLSIPWRTQHRRCPYRRQQEQRSRLYMMQSRSGSRSQAQTGGDPAGNLEEQPPLSPSCDTKRQWLTTSTTSSPR